MVHLRMRFSHLRDNVAPIQLVGAVVGSSLPPAALSSPAKDRGAFHLSSGRLPPKLNVCFGSRADTNRYVGEGGNAEQPHLPTHRLIRSNDRLDPGRSFVGGQNGHEGRRGNFHDCNALSDR
jgi:hypothetical protein